MTRQNNSTKSDTLRTVQVAQAECIATHLQIWDEVKKLTCDAPVSLEQAQRDVAAAVANGTAEKMLLVALLELKQVRDAVRDFQPKPSIVKV